MWLNKTKQYIYTTCTLLHFDSFAISNVLFINTIYYIRIPFSSILVLSHSISCTKYQGIMCTFSVLFGIDVTCRNIWFLSLFMQQWLTTIEIRISMLKKTMSTFIFARSKVTNNCNSNYLSRKTRENWLEFFFISMQRFLGKISCFNFFNKFLQGNDICECCRSISSQLVWSSHQHS